MISKNNKTYEMSLTYSPDPRDFGVINSKNYVSWYICRDEFQDRLYGMSIGRFLYNCRGGCAQKTKDFIKKIESLIKLPKSKRIKFKNTNYKDILYLTLGDFWKTLVHRSLLTILLRAGERYDKKKDNWKNVILKDEYLSCTKQAINRFLKGYTRPTFNYFDGRTFLGWVDEYDGDDKSSIKLKLR